MTTEPPQDASTTDQPERESGAPPSPPPGPRRLTRSRTDQVIGGVSGGLGAYLDVDPVLIRIAWVALVLFAGTGILLYILAWVIIPEEDPDAAGQPTRTSAAPSAHASAGTSGALVLAVVLIAIGGIALLRSIDVNVPSWRVVLSAILALIGVGLIAQARRGLNGGLVAIGVIVSVMLAGAGGVSIGVDIDTDSAFGDRREAPRTAAALDDSYSHAFGSFTLDLGDLDLATLPPGTTHIEVDTGFGSVKIRHGGLPVRVEASSVFGSSDDFEAASYATADRRILIDLSTAFGSSDVGR
jgi:phage shock protein PspC (stress-responsive transcriptional regulator)